MLVDPARIRFGGTAESNYKPRFRVATAFRRNRQKMSPQTDRFGQNAGFSVSVLGLPSQTALGDGTLLNSWSSQRRFDVRGVRQHDREKHLLVVSHLPLKVGSEIRSRSLFQVYSLEVDVMGGVELFCPG